MCQYSTDLIYLYVKIHRNLFMYIVDIQHRLLSQKVTISDILSTKRYSDITIHHENSLIMIIKRPYDSHVFFN